MLHAMPPRPHGPPCDLAIHALLAIDTCNRPSVPACCPRAATAAVHLGMPWMSRLCWPSLPRPQARPQACRSSKAWWTGVFSEVESLEL